MDNLELWNTVNVTDIDTVKNFKGKGGFKGTAVCAQSQRKKATEMFGVYGIGWGIKNESYDLIELDKNDCHYTKLAYRAILYFEWDSVIGNIPISSEIDTFSYIKSYDTWVLGNDLYKKVRTDAMTKGLSELGFNSDVFEGKFDDNKYIQELKQKQGKQKPPFNRQKEIDSISELVKTKTLTDADKAQIKTDIKHAKTKENFDVIYANVEGLG